MNGTFCLFGILSRVYSDIYGLGTIIAHLANELTPYRVRFDGGDELECNSNSFELRRSANGEKN